MLKCRGDIFVSLSLRVTNSQTIIFAGGGTGGHVYPGIAVAQALRKRNSNVHPLFLCTQREIDRTILQPTGFEFIPQPIVPPVRSVGGLLRFWKSWRETKDLVRNVLKERKPAAVLGLGGYAAGVAVRASAQRIIPGAILNPDVVPGKANQFLSRYVQAICCQFSQSAEYLPTNQRGKVKVTGCPIREDILPRPDRAASAQRLGLNPRLQTLTITGASQGAQTVNEAVLTMVPQLNLQGWQILHLAGRDHAANVREAYREHESDARVIDFTPNMADVWAVTDLAIARSGASTCAELTACGVGAILMPYPFHKDKHQTANANVLVNAGAAVLIDDDKDAKKNAAKLTPAVELLLRDSAKRQAMSEAARKLGRPDAADAVAETLLEIARSS
jgi:UDP-N-acetylglucosamine--N-acetylmuramyl-(pentapeptide) pyrophosphoryl-undecaprenol N-acetylglucosamine transferase